MKEIPAHSGSSTIIFRFALKFTDHHQAAEDIATEILLKVWENRSGFTEWNKLKSFLFTSVRNASINYLRDEKRHAAHHDQILRETTPEYIHEIMHHPVSEQVFAQIEDLIRLLPEKMKSVLILQLHGLSNNEIALKMGLAEKTVRNLKVEALKMLRIEILNKESFSLLFFTVLAGLQS
ncbi:MAG TPA: sigma-70 family RNA polymerase sigma factor [Parasegetibacter sp.]